jgi:hypothetical protein
MQVRTSTKIVCLIAPSIQQAVRQLTTPQVKPPKITSQCGCFMGAAGA